MTDLFVTPNAKTTVVKKEITPRVNFPSEHPVFLAILLVTTIPIEDRNFGKEIKRMAEWTGYNASGERCKLTCIGKFADEIHDDFM
jgi:hypothetical protein